MIIFLAPKIKGGCNKEGCSLESLSLTVVLSTAQLRGAPARQVDSWPKNLLISLQIYGKEKPRMLVSDMKPIAVAMHETLIEKMEEKNLGIAGSKIERYAIVLDPRRKGFTPCMDSATFSATVDAIKHELLLLYPEDTGGQPPQPPQQQPPAGHQDALRQRRLQRLAEADAAALQRNWTLAKTSAISELIGYLSSPLEREDDDFSLYLYWKEKANPKLDKDGKTLAPAVWPKLAKFAARYVSFQATSCDAERNFSALSDLLADKRSSLRPSTVEKCMLLRLNRDLLPGFAELAALEGRRQINMEETKRLVRAALAVRRKVATGSMQPAAAAADAAAGSAAAGGGSADGGGTSAASDSAAGGSAAGGSVAGGSAAGDSTAGARL